MPPDLAVERGLIPAGGLLAACDEVGRGSLGGPVSVGVVVLDASVGEPPDGVDDSKRLSARAREALVGPIREWADGSAVGHASAREIDEVGIITALRLEANRALDELAGDGLRPDVALVDGPHDWLSPPAQRDMFDQATGWTGQVVCLVRADTRCAAVAAASVLAKVERDAVMAGYDTDWPGYGWGTHKGYGTAAHLAALAELGPTEVHRRSFAPLADRPGRQ